MKKILAATALTMMFTAGALAQVNVTDHKGTRTSLDQMAGEGNTSVVDIFMDENGMDREEADYQARWEAATPEQRAMMKDVCEKGAEANLGFTDTVKSRCLRTDEG